MELVIDVDLCRFSGSKFQAWGLPGIWKCTSAAVWHGVTRTLEAAEQYRRWLCCRQAVIGVICATLPIIVSCVTVGIITSVNNYPAGIADSINRPNFTYVPNMFLTATDNCISKIPINLFSVTMLSVSDACDSINERRQEINSKVKLRILGVWPPSPCIF